ncbi:hypothetical protein FRC10_002623 [Ceratobasidium sp. 414]|nr:hypothetical protein FRC10_002623 [Ceratobasidium sp. 414]
MAKHIQRMEALAIHRAYLDHVEDPDADDPDFDGDEDEQEGGKEDDEGGDDKIEFEGLQCLTLDDKADNQGEHQEAGDEAQGSVFVTSAKVEIR